MQCIVVEPASADRNVIIGFRHPVGPTDDTIIQGHGGLAKKNFHLISAISATVPESKIAELRNDSNVLYVENDSIFRIVDAYTDEYNNSWGVQRIGSQVAHNQGINGTGIKVAVLDTGIDYTHIDLKDNYKGGYNFVDNNSDPWDDNCLTLSKTCHGTHVSGIIAAEKNGIGVVGVAPNASIYAIKVLDASGFGSATWIISGIQWAVDNNMNIISMSFSGEDDISVHNAVDNAYNAGLLLVAAAGNTYGGNVTYPGGYDSVIAVTATDRSDMNASFDPVDPKIELAAPGVDVNSTTINNSYSILSGTSMAAPHVTGVAALIYSTGVKDNRDVREMLHRAKHIGKNNIYGYGLVDVPMALGLSEGASVIGMVYNDSNRNGKKDPDETGLANWTIRLSGYTLTKTIVNRLAVTDASGIYSFTDVTPGSYIVCENFQPKWSPTTSACVWVKNESKIVNFGNVYTIPPRFRR